MVVRPSPRLFRFASIVTGTLASATALAAVDLNENNFGWFGEPIAGYSVGQFQPSVTRATPPLVKASLSGLSAGLRFGAVNKNYFVAGRFEYRLLSGMSGATGVTNMIAGVDLGVTLSQIPLRIYLGLNALDTLSKVSSAALQANGLRAGLGYFVTNNVSLNFDYTMRSYARTAINSELVDFHYNDWMLSISLPITFGIRSIPEVARGITEPSGIRKLRKDRRQRTTAPMHTREERGSAKMAPEQQPPEATLNASPDASPFAPPPEQGRQ